MVSSEIITGFFLTTLLVYTVSELRRERLEFSEAKKAGICEAEYQRGGRYADI